MMPRSKGLSLHELAREWVKDPVTLASNYYKNTLLMLIFYMYLIFNLFLKDYKFA